VSLKAASKFTKCLELVFIKVSSLGHGCVLHWYAVPVTEEEHISVSPLWFFGTNIHHVKIKSRKNISKPQRPRAMSAPGLFKHYNNIAADIIRFLFELCMDKSSIKTFRERMVL
jgi:hypothetical protein